MWCGIDLLELVHFCFVRENIRIRCLFRCAFSKIALDEQLSLPVEKTSSCFSSLAWLSSTMFVRKSHSLTTGSKRFATPDANAFVALFRRHVSFKTSWDDFMHYEHSNTYLLVFLSPSSPISNIVTDENALARSSQKRSGPELPWLGSRVAAPATAALWRHDAQDRSCRCLPLSMVSHYISFGTNQKKSSSPYHDVIGCSGKQDAEENANIGTAVTS